MKSRILICLLICFLLTGCLESFKNIVYVDKPTYVKPPAAMLIDCEATAPPVKEEYLVATSQKKEQYLFEYSNSLITDISVCNVQLESLRKWNIDQEKIYTVVKP